MSVQKYPHPDGTGCHPPRCDPSVHIRGSACSSWSSARLGIDTGSLNLTRGYDHRCAFRRVTPTWCTLALIRGIPAHTPYPAIAAGLQLHPGLHAYTPSAIQGHALECRGLSCITDACSCTLPLPQAVLLSGEHSTHSRRPIPPTLCCHDRRTSLTGHVTPDTHHVAIC